MRSARWSLSLAAALGVVLASSGAAAQTTAAQCGCVFREFFVGFGWSSAGLTPETRGLIDQAAAYYREQPVKPRRVNIDANADASEREDISQERVVVVEDRLIAEGVPKQIIVTTAHGDGAPLQPVSKDAEGARNRMTTISLN